MKKGVKAKPEEIIPTLRQVEMSCPPIISPEKELVFM